MNPLVTWLIAISSAVAISDVDTDGDGLSDFQEVHKYFTDPASADSDGDGVPDGDWHERREFTYTVRTILDLLPPYDPDTLSDDYQDARVLEVGPGSVQIEVIHYPFNTNAEAIEADLDWREHTASMTEYLRPRPTSNWDEAMRKELIAALGEDGIDVETLSDREVVEKVSAWLMSRSSFEDGFTTFLVDFEDGVPVVCPELLESFQGTLTVKGRTAQEQWNRELFGKGMFENRVRGSCTSSAIYLQTALRALGIPTRTIICVPAVDASDPYEVELVTKRLSHHEVRRTLEKSTRKMGSSWASHTFNEVFVGGRWRRLNYARLGQNILDEHYLGLMTHVHTYLDHADAGLSPWGLRNARRPKDDVFGGSNPYSCVSLSDRFGEHAKIENKKARALTELTISRLYWFDDPGKDPTVTMRLEDPDTAGHLLMHVEEDRPGDFGEFFERVPKAFVLRSEGQEDIPARAERGYWTDSSRGIREFYLRIAPQDFESMVMEVPYSLHTIESETPWRWVVQEGVRITRTVKAANEASAAGDVELRTLTKARWAHTSQPGIFQGMAPEDGSAILLLHVEEWDEEKGFADFKRFTQEADRHFVLEAEGHPPVKISSGVGGFTGSNDIHEIMAHVSPRDFERLAPGIEYTLRPLNESPTCHWKVAEDLRVVRR